VVKSCSFKSSSISLFSVRFSQNNTPDELDPDTILFESCNYNHWLLVIDFSKDNKPSPEEMVRAYKENIQANIRELEEEVKLLKNIKHPNIVRYLGTAREENSLNILLEFVPGDSISSLLGKFGSFPECIRNSFY